VKALLAALVSLSATAAEVQLTTGAGGSYRLPVMSWKEIPFRSVVRQQYDFSCGSAAVATLLSYGYERPTLEKDVFSAMWVAGDQATIRKVGFSMLDIKRYLESIGYKVEGYRLPLEQLQQQKRPGLVILDMKGRKHFVVIKGAGPDGLLVGDPVAGLMHYSATDFKSHWNGIFLAIADDPRKLAPRFNLASEWRPWSTAPLGDADLQSSISSLTDHLPPPYQITPVVSATTRSN
jgi:uncharacterized protein